MERPVKQSNYVGRITDLGSANLAVRDIGRDLDNIMNYLRDFPRLFIQATEPTIQDNTFAFWKDTDDDKYYLILNVGGTAKTVELT